MTLILASVLNCPTTSIFRPQYYPPSIRLQLLLWRCSCFLKSILKIKDDIVGIGKRPSHGDELEVHYRGWYYSPNSTEGIKFDDSRDRDPKKGLIFDYGISPIIQGWNLGIKTMNQGGVRSIIIPPYLGYGNKTVHATGRPSIPGNSELVFELELLAHHAAHKVP